jgi:hypothetical protein
LFLLFGVMEVDASVEGFAQHAEWLQTRGWTLVEWLGDEGDRWRSRYGLTEISQSFKSKWQAFLTSNRNRTLPDVIAEIDRLREAYIERLTRKKERGRPPRRTRRPKKVSPEPFSQPLDNKEASQPATEGQETRSAGRSATSPILRSTRSR